MTLPKITRTAEMKLPSNLTVAELKNILAQIPDTAKIDVDHYEGGGQFDPSSNSIIFTWSY